ncbi:sporulation histidine kinase inhibitor Sda [Halalkalibacter akibai]|nr:sporulation histidine kinase inhibitor Sda [Halalkalibacter akibai]
MFDNLNNQAMLEAYYEAVSLGLDIEFIMIIKKN